MTTNDIINQLKKAEEQIHYRNLSLTIRKPVEYTVEIVNHLGEVIGISHHNLLKDLDIDLLTRWDVPQVMMTTDPYKTINKFFDEAREKTASILFDLSLTHTIQKITCNGYDYISLWIDETTDGDTNIDASVVSEVLGIVEQKRMCWFRSIR